MPDKHEVGGSSPLGPTTESKTLKKEKNSRGRPRAFVEREPTQKGGQKQEGRDDEPKGKIKSPRDISTGTQW